MLRKKRLGKLQGVRLHLGCGKRIVPGCIHLDCFASPGIDFECDFREPLPLASGAAEMIYSEHVLEHLEETEALKLLRECHRVLIPSGRIRIGVPDGGAYCRAYASGNHDFFAAARNIGNPCRPLNTPMKIINQMARMGGHHRFAWDEETLRMALEEAGFTQILRTEPGKSRHASLILDDPIHAFETLYFEAAKP